MAKRTRKLEWESSIFLEDSDMNIVIREKERNISGSSMGVSGSIEEIREFKGILEKALIEAEALEQAYKQVRKVPNLKIIGEVSKLNDYRLQEKNIDGKE